MTLLRFLESGEFLRLGETQVLRADVRIIAATNRELRLPAEGGNFRRDLLFRLNEVEISLPPLRDRQDDILPLAHHFLGFYGGLEGPRLSPDAEAVLRSYAWPGNVRELENVMRRVAALHSGTRHVDAVALLPFLGSVSAPKAAAVQGGDGERARILAAYEEADGNKSRLAKLLGVSRKTLYARIKRLNIELESFSSVVPRCYLSPRCHPSCYPRDFLSSQALEQSRGDSDCVSGDSHHCSSHSPAAVASLK